MQNLDQLNEKIEQLIKKHVKLQHDHDQLIALYEKQLKRNEKLEGEIKKMQLRIDDLVLQSTVNILSSEQKHMLKIQLAEIIERIDSNLKLL
jgi:ribosomal protein S17